MTEDKNKEILEELDVNSEETEEQIVVITDDEGKETFYREEMVIPVGQKTFAILVGFDPEADEEEGCHCHDEGCGCHDEGCGCHDEEDENIIIAKVVFDEKGEETYVGPTDEEFEEVRKAYEAMFEGEEE